MHFRDKRASISTKTNNEREGTKVTTSGWLRYDGCEDMNVFEHEISY